MFCGLIFVPALYLYLVYVQVAESVDERAGQAGVCQKLDIEVNGCPADLVPVVKLGLGQVLRYVDHHIDLLLADKVQSLRALSLFARPVNQVGLYVVVF